MLSAAVCSTGHTYGHMLQRGRTAQATAPPAAPVLAPGRRDEPADLPDLGSRSIRVRPLSAVPRVAKNASHLRCRSGSWMAVTGPEICQSTRLPCRTNCRPFRAQTGFLALTTSP